jgi:hypothetical protein
MLSDVQVADDTMPTLMRGRLDYTKRKNTVRPLRWRPSSRGHAQSVELDASGRLLQATHGARGVRLQATWLRLSFGWRSL